MRENGGRLKNVAAAEGVMAVLWIAILITGPVLCGLLLYKVLTFEDKDSDRFMRPVERRDILIPRRGDILDCKGRVLATSIRTYKVYLDCVAPKDTVWNTHIDSLSTALSRYFADKTPAGYKAVLTSARKTNKRHLLFKKGLDQMDINEMREMPLFRLGQYAGGYIEECRERRRYPYGSLASATLGLVVTNKGKCLDKRGIEGSFDDVLHGIDGSQLYRRGEFGMEPVNDSGNRPSIDGKDVQLTLDIDIQAIADSALRHVVEADKNIEKSCVIVLESMTGAVRAMVNLGREKDRDGLGEWANYALRSAEAPGSVFKGAVLMSLLEEGYVTSLSHRVPTYGGIWTYNGKKYEDYQHVGRSVCPSGYITVREAFAKSANNPFRQLLCDERTFGSKPSRFVDKVKGFGIFDTLGFDIKGATRPFIVSPDTKAKSKKGFWNGSTFPTMAIGYNMELPPVNIVTFYNAIACSGQMMKPYIVDRIVSPDGDCQVRNPVILRENICRKSTADTIRRAMTMVTENKLGTAYWQFRGSKCRVAGKTGTAQRVFKSSVTRKNVTYDDKTDERSHQGSFVGFFPIDKPKYTAIVVIWSKPSKKDYFGATYAAPVFREIAEKLYCLNVER